MSIGEPPFSPQKIGTDGANNLPRTIKASLTEGLLYAEPVHYVARHLPRYRKRSIRSEEEDLKNRRLSILKHGAANHRRFRGDAVLRHHCCRHDHDLARLVAKEPPNDPTGGERQRPDRCSELLLAGEKLDKPDTPLGKSSHCIAQDIFVEIPLMPFALTSSSTERVKTP